MLVSSKGDEKGLVIFFLNNIFLFPKTLDNLVLN